MKNRILLTIFILSLFITSCSNIRYWTDKPKHDFQMLSNDELIEEQIKNLQTRNPEKDCIISFYTFDKRFVGVTSIGDWYPGIADNYELLHNYGGKAIWGTTDVNMDNYLYAWGVYYAYRYNKKLCELLDVEFQIDEYDIEVYQRVEFLLKKSFL